MKKTTTKQNQETTAAAFDFRQLATGTTLLITTDNWFTGPDGNQYKSAFGVARVLQSKDVLGFNSRGGANWMVQVGEGDGAVFIMGCQIHYAIVTTRKPQRTDVYCPEDFKIKIGVTTINYSLSR